MALSYLLIAPYHLDKAHLRLWLFVLSEVVHNTNQRASRVLTKTLLTDEGEYKFLLDEAARAIQKTSASESRP